VRGDRFHIGSLDREDDHGEEGEDEEADRGKEKGRSGTQEEKGGKGNSKEIGEDGEEGDEAICAEAQSASAPASPCSGRSGSILVSVLRRLGFRRRRQQLAALTDGSKRGRETGRAQAFAAKRPSQNRASPWSAMVLAVCLHRLQRMAPTRIASAQQGH